MKKGTSKKKTQTTTLVPIPSPPSKGRTNVNHVVAGPPVPPIVRIRHFSPAEWEEFIAEWVTSLKEEYHSVMKCGEAGDMGRDIVGYTGEISSGSAWDNYQCKHYDHALTPTDIWPELGKLVYYTFIKEFTVPRKYYFVCPHDVGTKLSRLFENPEKLRKGLIENWDKYCKTGITSSKPITLDGLLLQHVQTFPFERVAFKPVLKILTEHRETAWHIHRFGGGFPTRPQHDTPPDAIGDNELRYVGELLRAYSDHVGSRVTETNLNSQKLLSSHFTLSRASFYSAESLKAFSRDHLPPGEFELLQNEVCTGVQEAYLAKYNDGYQKVLGVTASAVQLQITDHALVSVLRNLDRRGICHQLVDLEELIWVEADNE